MSFSWSKVATPNARAIFQELPMPVLDWGKGTLVLDHKLSQLPNIQLANPFHDLYFFSPTSDENFPELDYWVAREIIGPITEDQLDEELRVIDLDHSSAYEVPVSFSSESSWKEVFEQEKIARSIIEKEKGIELADTWRLRLIMKTDQAQVALPAVRLQFFSEDEGEEDA